MAQMEVSSNNVSELVGVLKSSIQQKDPIDMCFDDIEKVDKHAERLERADEYSPAKKVQLREILKKRKKELGNKIIALDEGEEGSEEAE